MVALDPRWLAVYDLTPASLHGWISLAGPYDFIPIQNKDTRPAFFYPATLPESQPNNHVNSSAPPALHPLKNTIRVLGPVNQFIPLLETL